MKVLHVTYGFLPDPPGGTELYVHGLAQQLAALGVHSTIAAPGDADDAYTVGGIDVRRFGCDPARQTLDVLYGAGDARASLAFSRVLEEVKPDVLHQHAWSPACSTDLVRQTKAARKPVVFTYHTPTVSCQRGTLLRFGLEPCSGVLDERLCTACVLDAAGMNPFVRAGIGAVPRAVGRSIGRHGFQGGMWTALRLPSLMKRRLAETRELFDLVDAWISLTPWVTRVLIDNGVSPSRIVESSHGVDHRSDAERDSQQPGTLRLAYFGRLDTSKGLNVLFDALKQIPEAEIELDVYAIRQAGSEREARAVDAIAAADARVRVLTPVPHDKVADALKRYDAVVIPSQTFETGPLILLESQACGVPAIGSAVGGLADKIRHDETGLLVTPFDSPAAWAAAVQRCIDDRPLLPRLRSAIRPPRTMLEVAHEMMDVYQRVTTHSREQNAVRAPEPV